MTTLRATVIGFVAVLLWALLALFTVGSAPVPPLQLNAICFGIGGGLGLVWSASTGGLHRLRGVPLRVYVFGTAGLLGYHALYFSALRLAPAAEAGLIAYLWPLLIVVFSGLLPGERLRAGHIVGAITGFLGAALIISGGSTGFQAAHLPGYGLALICALFWSGYSVGSRGFGAVPTDSVAVFCIASAVLSVPLHLAFETTQWPVDTTGWASTIALGLGPVGLAFYVWDIGVKRGDIQLLGTASYAAPLLSTLVLVLAGVTEASWSLAAAALLVTGGAVIAARASFGQGLSG
ncbi:aromatic amino acid exporter YddG [Pseudosulfitobacter koreensis]|uniref:EamA family transporter n=1 Tax=Pseudosulfitobacter koreensis TaxID=2968472 RepID=A0ABT1YYZ8_9RHOB|nr:EamA family transporter [Pseudosulfitobacter koreense]MCR8826110.1 EamA family transporter [Pseudosulfitobacter koreense]